MSSAQARRPVAVDLFSGVGGFSLGFEQAGFDVLAAVEYDPIHAATHAFNSPQTAIVCADARSVSARTLRAAIQQGHRLHGRPGKWDGKVDVVLGGPPCQGFSVGGKLAVNDERNTLVFEFARLVGILKPKYFVMENVPAMRTALDARAGTDAANSVSLLGSLYLEFDRLGYEVDDERVLNACDHAVPQDRRRLFVLGRRRRVKEAVLPRPTVRAVPKRRGAAQLRARLAATEGLPVGPTVTAAIGGLPNLDDFTELWKCDEVTALWAEEGTYARRLRNDESDPDDFSRPRAWDKSLLTASLRTAHSLKTIQRFEATLPGHSEAVSRFYRLDPNGLSSTLRAGTGYDRGSFSAPRPIHPEYQRVISVREAARLHSFPDWFRFHVTKWHGFRQVGNALPPILGRAVAKALLGALGLTARKPKAELALGDTTLLSLGMVDAASHFGVDTEAIPSNGMRTRARAARAAADEEGLVA